MAEQNNRYLSYSQYFNALANKYGDMPIGNIQNAMQRAIPFSGMNLSDPNVQNRRVKKISSLPVDYDKNQIVDMLKHPNEHEQGLRQVSNILEYTAYPMFKIRTTYQDLLTYHHYVYPAYLEKEDAGTDAFKREWRMMCKLEEEIQPERTMRQIVGQCVRDGKVFYTPRVDADKAHNKIYCAFAQQLPQDWVKITGLNNISKYSVAFNMFYFLQPGTSYKQFGELFEPYLDDFIGVFEKKAKINDRGVLFASAKDVDMKRMMAVQKSSELRMNGTPEVYQQNGTWYYRVYLSPEKVWTFEIDDVKPTVISPLSGLFLSMEQITQYEAVQMEIVQNPLISMVLGQIETYDAVAPGESDPLKISPTGKALFESMFYQMLSAQNTGGVGIYAAPFKDMKLVQLAEAPNANKISSAGYEYAMEKSGMSALMPTSSEARAGVAQISLKLESRYAQHMYWQFERMMNTLMANLKPKATWKFRMFGDLASDDAALKSVRDEMTLGLLPAAFEYNALHGRTMLDDMSMSSAVLGLNIMDMRKPLESTFSKTQTDSNGAPDEGGRPPNEDGPITDGAEADYDDGKGGE